MPLFIADKAIATTAEGFLKKREDWTPEVANALARAHSIELLPAHWEIMDLLRDYCDRGNEPPSMRELVKEIRAKLDQDRAKSIYLMRLFGPSPAKMAARLSGLPRPKNCL